MVKQTWYFNLSRQPVFENDSSEVKPAVRRLKDDIILHLTEGLGKSIYFLKY